MFVVKRNRSKVVFDAVKIEVAIGKAFQAEGSFSSSSRLLRAQVVTEVVVSNLTKQGRDTFQIEEIQDMVEKCLMELGYFEVGKVYILYRQKRAEARLKLSKLEEVITSSSDIDYFAGDVMGQFVFERTYARWREEDNRRETWPETVTRYMTFMKQKLQDKLSEDEYSDVEDAILEMKVMPSMRLLQFAGPAAERCNACVYNCAFIAPESPSDLAEIMYLSMSGTGVGFSVESVHVAKFPIIQPQGGNDILTICTIEDSKEGWANAFKFGMTAWFEGRDVQFDYSKLRPAGARLKTTGGRSSGPQPLRDLMGFTREIMLSKPNQKLSPLNLHDIICKIGQIVVSGGSRRCIAKGGKVITMKDSFKNIEDVVVGDHVLTYAGWKPVVKTMYQGMQETIKIHHQEGILECTPNHRVAVFKDWNSDPIWKEASTLREGDVLGFPKMWNDDHCIEPVDGVDQMPSFTYAKPKHSTTCKDIVIPPLDTQIAWFIGNIQGDGYVRLTSKSGLVSVAVHGDDVEQKDYTELAFKRFGVNVSTYQPKVTDYCFKVTAKSKQLAVFMHTHVKQPKVSMHVPEFIKVASPRIKACFVQGLMDADGCVKTRPIQVVCSVYPDYLRQVQALLQSIGITTRMKHTKATTEGWQDKYHLNLINNRDKQIFMFHTEGIGFKKFGLRDKVQNANGWNTSHIRFDENIRQPSDWRDKVDSSVARNANVPCDSLEKYFDIHTRVLPIKVKKIIREENPGAKPTYDIEVQDNHNFVCDGVLVHNSALLSLSDLHDAEIRDCKNGPIWNTNSQRYMSNNSAVYTHKPDAVTFMTEWLKLAESGTGERGIFNRSGLKELLPQRRVQLLGDRVDQIGSNPCCVAGDTWVQTKIGPTRARDLVGVENVELVISGQPYPVVGNGFFHTGDKEVFEINTYGGRSVLLTADHQVLTVVHGKECWTEARHLQPGISVVRLSDHQGWNHWPGKGTYTTGLGVGTKMFLQEVDSESLDMYEHYSSDFTIGVVARMLDLSDSKSRTFSTIKSPNREIQEYLQRSLQRLGVVAAIEGQSVFIHQPCVTTFVDLVQPFDPWLAKKLACNIEDDERYRGSSIFSDAVMSVKFIGVQPVYDVTIDHHIVHEFCGNGFRLHNCEILLQSKQFCNLSEVVCRNDDTIESLYEKIRIATLLGTYQATLSNFKFLSQDWTTNQEEERLLGVSLTGIMDCPLLTPKAEETDYERLIRIDLLQNLKKKTITYNLEYAKRFNIKPATAITCVKPSGSVSQMTNSSSGIHTRYAKYYRRRIRIAAHDPLFNLMKDQNYLYFPEVGQDRENPNTWVLEFPIKAPEGAICTSDMTALQQLEFWKDVKMYYTEHNPSVTINVKSHEWIDVQKWVYDNWKYITGLSFLPYNEHKYELAPYEEMTEQEYLQHPSLHTIVNFAKLPYYEKSDTTDVKREVACAGGLCEI